MTRIVMEEKRVMTYMKINKSYSSFAPRHRVPAVNRPNALTQRPALMSKENNNNVACMCVFVRRHVTNFMDVLIDTTNPVASRLLFLVKPEHDLRLVEITIGNH
jgi:hypothetical protein